ncbi:TNT domain-containing protein [Saccharopolyspora sp. NPDC047091]|uniref:TNT domain-containing protein n=1 Tax=Saccharopolyspora sp. NPDC047091 TaxID=3155924 RepID=UPI0033CBE5A6
MIVGTPVAGTLALVDGRWHGWSESRDGSAVLAGFEAPVPVERIGSVVVVQGEPPEPGRAFPAPAAHGAPTEPALRPDARAELGAALRAAVPAGARGVGVECTALGTRVEVSGTATTDSGEHAWIPPQEVLDALRRARVVEYRPESGAWTTARCTAAPGGAPVVEFGHDRPAEVAPQDAFDELRHFPRPQAPEWLLGPAWRHYEQHRAAGGAGPVRMARLFDGADAEGRPFAYRPVLPWVEKRLLVDYLSGGAVVLAARSTSADEVDPSRPAEVPKRFHTDGSWVWPLSMAYYLDVHDIAPPRDFLDHVRARAHRLPELVADHAVEQAKALVLGSDADEFDAERTAGAIDLARRFIAALGVSRRRYNFAEPVEAGWSMLREADGWWSVFCVDGGEVRNHSRFPEAHAAAAHLIGAVALNRSSMQREPDEPLAEYECRIVPLGPDLPLSAYGERRHAMLPDGAEVDRFGTPDGNTVFVAGTTLPQRSLPPGREPGEYRRYRVVRSFEVLTAVAAPDHGQVGGGTAHLLPQPVGELVAGGWLAEV